VLNGKDEPKKEYLKLLLDAIYKVDVRTSVAKAAYNNVIKRLATDGIKCEIYLNGKNVPDKTYYVGGQTEDDLGTFMMLENSSTPFITEIPGLNGYLTPRFSTKIEAWKQTILFRLQPKELKSLLVKYTNYPEKSFSIAKNGSSYIVECPANKKRIMYIDSVAVDNYLSFYQTVYFESLVTGMKTGVKDSILQYPPSIVISLTKENKEDKEVQVYPMAVSKTSLVQQDSLGNPLKFDVDRMYGFVKPENEFIILQHYTFDKLLRQFNDFDLSLKRNTFKN
jgi:hypothetical protein